MPNSDTTTQQDVALDILAALEMYTGLCGSETTTIEKMETVTEYRNQDSFTVILSNGDEYTVAVRPSR